VSASPAVLPAPLGNVPLSSIVRIDAALEGDWSGTVVAVWTRDDGLLGFDAVRRADPARRPALELYFPGFWIGLHCCTEVGGTFVFDEARARAVIAHVEARLGLEPAAAPLRSGTPVATEPGDSNAR
jgi:hypothetical protein